MSLSEQTPSQEKIEKRQIVGNSYEIIHTIGEGTFGKVKLATHIKTNQKVAIKILEKEKIVEQEDVERITREIKILKKIRHPHIIQLFDLLETDSDIFLIMEYANGGELFDLIVQKNRLKETEACKYFQQLISGVEYFHKEHKVVHRDLKPENLLLDSHQNLKIVDFGLSNTYDQDEKLRTACGSPCYAAPEMVAGNMYHGLNVDIWSCGIVLYAMVCGFLPFEDNDTSKLYQKIIQGEFEIPDWLSQNCVDILKKILDTNPETRIKIQEIRRHQWYQLANEDTIISKLLENLQNRAIDEKALEHLEQQSLYDKEFVKSSVLNNQFNEATTAYYLYLNKRISNIHRRKLELKNGLPINVKTIKQVPKNKQKKNIQQAKKKISLQEGKAIPRSLYYHNKSVSVDVTQSILKQNSRKNEAINSCENQEQESQLHSNNLLLTTINENTDLQKLDNHDQDSRQNQVPQKEIIQDIFDDPILVENQVSQD